MLSTQNPATPRSDSMANQAAAEAQQRGQNYSGGDALLDAEAKAEEKQSTGNPIDEPTATNITGKTNRNEPKNAKAFTNTTGAYPPDEKRLDKDYKGAQIERNQEGPA